MLTVTTADGYYPLSTLMMAGLPTSPHLHSSRLPGFRNCWVMALVGPLHLVCRAPRPEGLVRRSSSGGGSWRWAPVSSGRNFFFGHGFVESLRAAALSIGGRLSSGIG